MANVIDQSYTNQDNQWALRYGATTNIRMGGAFYPSLIASCSQIVLKLRKNNSPSGNIWIEIYADNLGLPGSLIATSDTMAASSVSSVQGDYTFTFSGANKKKLYRGIRYHFALCGDYTVSSSNYITFANDVSGSYTPSGSENYNATSWSDPEPTTDPYFIEYYDDTTVVSMSSEWSTRLDRRVPYTKVSGSANLSNFPVLIKDGNLSDAFYAALNTPEIIKNSLYSDANLIAYWRMEGNSNDTKASHHGSDTAVSYVNGRFGQEASFNGSSSFISIADSADWNFGSGNFSVSFWAKQNTTTGVQRIFGQVDSAFTATKASFYVYLDAGRPAAVIVGGSTYYATATSTAISTDRHLYTMVRDGNTLYMYIDGEVYGTRDVTGVTMNNSDQIFAIGRLGAYNSDYFNGQVDDFAVFSRALSVAEIQKLYKTSDLRITTDSAGTTEIPYEIVSLDTTAKTCEIHAKVPTLSYTADTPIYLWAGNANAIAYDANAPFGSQAVWSDYRAVYHLNETSGNRSDSTSNGYTLTDVNSVLYATGQIGNGADFESTNSEYFTGANAIIPWGTNTLSVQFWQKSESTGANQSYTMTARTNQGLNIYIAGGTLTFSKPNVVDLNVAITEDTNWHRYSFLADGTGMSTIIDAGTPTTNANTSNFVSPSSDSVHIGAYLSGGSLQAGWYRDGIIDEFRVKGTRVTTDWDATEYANQNDPATFLVEASVVKDIIGGFIPFAR